MPEKGIKTRLLELEQSNEQLLSHIVELEKRVKRIEDDAATLRHLSDHDGDLPHAAHH